MRYQLSLSLADRFEIFPPRPKSEHLSYCLMTTALHLGIVVAGLVGVCLAFAPTLPSPRLFSSSFAPHMVRSHPNLSSSVEKNRGSPIFSLDNDVEDDTSTGKETWNEITPELRQAGENFCRVTGVDPIEIKMLFDTLEELDRLETTLLCPEFFEKCIALLMHWKSIERGKDLFITEMGTFDINKAYRCIVERQNQDFEEEFIGMANKCSFDVWTKMESEIGGAKQRQIVLERTRHDWRLFFDKKEDMLRFCLGSARSLSYYGYTYHIKRPYWLVFPLELQCAGYFGLRQYSWEDFQPDDEDPRDIEGFQLNDEFDAREDIVTGMDPTIGRWELEFLLSQSEEYPQRQYLAKYYQDYFKQPRWQGYLDELILCGSRSPSRWLPDAQREDHILNIYQKAWPLHQSANEVGPPPQLFNRIRRFREEWDRQKRLAENVVYEHLNDLEDWEVRGIRLVVLRSKYEIYEVGKELQNCALDYAGVVTTRQGILIKAVREDGRAVALGLFGFEANRYSQIYGTRNEPVDENIRNAYYSYQTLIKKWADDGETGMRSPG